MRRKFRPSIKKAFLLVAAGFFMCAVTDEAWADKRKKKDNTAQREELEAVWDNYNWDNHPPELVKKKKRYHLEFDGKQPETAETEIPDESSWLEKNLERAQQRLREQGEIPAQ
jgi:hypothetical protein